MAICDRLQEARPPQSIAAGNPYADQFPAGKEELPREVLVLKQILFKASRQ